jgi:hypothetical protein
MRRQQKESANSGKDIPFTGHDPALARGLFLLQLQNS